MSEKVVIEVEGKDGLSKPMGDARDSLDTLSRSSKTLGEKLAGLGKPVGGLVDGLGRLGLAGLGVKTLAEGIGGLASSLIGGSAEFERYTTQFGVLLGSAEAAGERIKELETFGATTPFELPEVVRADKILQGFGLHAENTAKRFGFAGKDIRTIAGDVAAGTGAGFEEIAGYVGRFTSGATGEAIARFQELGIVTREQLTGMGLEFSKSGELLSPLDEATGVLLQAMKQKFGGMMDAQSGTFEGMVSNLTDWFGQTKRIIMQPIFDVLKDKLKDVLTFLSSDTVKNAISGFASILAKGIGGAVETIERVSTALAPILSVVGSALRDLVGGLRSGDMTSFIAGFQRLTGINIAPLQTAVDAVRTFIGAITGTWEPSPGIMQIHAIVGRVGMGFRDLASVIANNLKPILIGLGVVAAVTLGPALVGLAVAMAPILAVGALIAGVALAWQTNFLGIRDAVEAVGAKLTAFWNEIGPKIMPALTNIADFVVGVLGALVTTIGDHWDQIAGIFQGVWDVIAGIVQIAWSIVSGIIKIGLDILTGDWGAAWDHLTEMLSGVWEGIQRILGGALKTLGSTLSLAWDGIKAVAKGAWDGVTALIKGAINGIIGMVNQMIRGINSIEIKVPEIEVPYVGTVGGWVVPMPKIPEIPLLARGGIVTAPTLALLGEGNRREAVIPLDRGGHGLNIDYNALGRAIAGALAPVLSGQPIILRIDSEDIVVRGLERARMRGRV